LRLYYAKEGVPNFFVLKLKSSDRRWIPGGRIGPINVEAATPEEKARHGIYVPQETPSVTATVSNALPSPYPYAPPQPIEPPDPMAGIKQTLGLLKEFQEIGLVPKLERPKPEPVIQNPPQQFTEEDHIIRAALSSPEAQDRIAKGIFSKLIGGAAAADETPWYADIVKELVVGIVPGLNALATVAAQKMNQAQIAVAQAPMPSLPEAAPVEMQQPISQPIPAHQQEMPDEPDYDALLFGHILTLCKKRQFNTPDVAANDVLEFIQQGEGANGYNVFHRPMDIFVKYDAEILLTAAAAENPMAAKLAQESDVLPWLKSVQDEIRKEWAQDEQSIASES
jgi:hypothetical protein